MFAHLEHCAKENRGKTAGSAVPSFIASCNMYAISRLPMLSVFVLPSCGGHSNPENSKVFNLERAHQVQIAGQLLKR